MWRGQRRKEPEMKCSREFHDEDQARAHELFLKASGYRAWRNKKADGEWAVFWFPLPVRE